MNENLRKERGASYITEEKKDHSFVKQVEITSRKEFYVKVYDDGYDETLMKVLNKLKSNKIIIIDNLSTHGSKLAQTLTERGFSVAQIDADTPKQKRSEYNAAFVRRTRILISNGIEDDIIISQAYAVVFYDMIEDIDNYVQQVTSIRQSNSNSLLIFFVKDNDATLNQIKDRLKINIIELPGTFDNQI